MKPKPALSAAHPDRFRFFRWGAVAIAILLALLAGLSWPAFAARFSPMRAEFSQCQICARSRAVEVVCGRKVRDETSATEYSDWIDTFVPPGHQHVWQVGSSESRDAWFGSKMIACGDAGLLATIYQRRGELGDETCRQLLLKFHELVRDPSPTTDRYKLYAEFVKAVIDDPESLLVEDDTGALPP